MSYKHKTKEEQENMNYRQVHTNYPRSEHRFDQMLGESLRLYDKGLYFLRQEYFRCRDLDWAQKPKYDSWFDMCSKAKECSAWSESNLDINIKKQTLKKGKDAWTGWINAKADYAIHPEKYERMPQMPKYKYRVQNYYEVVIDKTRFRGSDESSITLPCTDIKVQIPKNIKKDWIVELHISKYNNRPRVTFVYDNDKKREYERQLSDAYGETHSTAVRIDKKAIKKAKKIEEKKKLIENFVPDRNKILSMDFGMVNVVTAMTFGCGADDSSFVIRGRYFQQRINETIEKISHLESAALLSANKECTKISKKDGQLKLSRNTNQMSNIWFEYNSFVDNQMGNISSMIIDYCLERNIGTIIIGLNEDWKRFIELGKKNNKVFCHIPHTRLCKTVKYKAKEFGINVIIVEESYTSKCDHLAFETMEHHDKYLGRRVSRGKFKSSTGRIVHGDVNGCIGMIRKANVIPDAVLMDGLRDRGDVVAPVVLNVRGMNPCRQSEHEKSQANDYKS